MTRQWNPASQKLAEKLTILNDRGAGLLTRIYNIKKACADPKSKPSFLSDKTLESCIKYVVKRFPNHIDVKSLQPLTAIRNEISKSLSLYYFTFVDLLDFKDNVSELLTVMDALQLRLNLSENFDLTCGYLNLVSTYVSLMILLSRVDDRKAVLGLFNAAHEMTHNQSDQSFPRLGLLVVEYDPPLKKLAEEFSPHSKLMGQALFSVRDVYLRRNLTADQWRSNQAMSIVSNAPQMLKPIQDDTLPCVHTEFCSLEVMEKWIIIGLSLCHHLPQTEVSSMWNGALLNGWGICLFRDEVWNPHHDIMSFFEGIKGYGKRVSEVKELHATAVQTSSRMHRDRRKFLRSALKELGLILTDQPGLLGPKALYVWTALSHARDEVTWLIRHHDNPPQKTKGKVAEELVDRHLPELLFHMEELRGLVRKYNQVLQRYYVQYLTGYDTVALRRELQELQVCPEDESIILSSIATTISSLSVKQVEEGELFDLRGVRLDWFRLQAYTSLGKAALPLKDHRNLAVLLNSVAFHTRMVDYLDEMLTEISDLSFFCFYNKQFEEQFHMCLEFPAQNRYIVAFPLICAHFQNCTHDLCPEERHHIRERSLSFVNMFLDEMAKEAKNIITTICDDQCQLADRLLPKHCAPHMSKKKREKNKRNVLEANRPGQESYRKSREVLTTVDKLHMALTELCFAINYCNVITLWDYAFAPREYLNQHIETRFAKSLVKMAMFNPETNEIAKPSELLVSLKAYMAVLQTVENYVHMDLVRVFNNVLLQQTQQADSQGEKTIAAHYTSWYAEVLRRVSAGHIVYSASQKAFVSLNHEGAQPVSPEEYSDVSELRALAELIGPYGMRLLSETLAWHIASQVGELKKLVVANKEVLIAMRTNFDNPESMRELGKKLTQVDSLLKRMTIIGVILAFKDLAQDALQDVLYERIPFLVAAIKDFSLNVPDPSTDNLLISEMANAAGLPVKVDPILINALRNQNTEGSEDEYVLACLLLVFVAVSIPRLARSESSQYKPNLEGHANNIHCLALGVHHTLTALFTQTKQGDLEERWKEFLALASSSLLRLGQDTDKESTKHRDSVYLLLHLLVKESPFLTMDLLESCFPYALLRNSYQAVYKQ